ncbi:MAG: YebC/PmpR family DNA-binding transcriptional regulator [Myxococcales bacterium]|nr:YebC/PmpR family DNA-binding transcriptional regulator [Myxococcales bacterium]
MGAQWKQKHRVAAADQRGRLFGKLAKEVMMAARGGADPALNAALRLAIDTAKKHSLPRDTLERAIKKGAGLLDGPLNLELVTYEGFAPHQVPVIVECLTDNKNRTASSMRVLFRKGQQGASGSVSWDFDRRGVIEAQPPAQGEDPEEAAIEAGADDVRPADDGAQAFLTAPDQLDAVGRALSERGWNIESSALAWLAKNPVTLEAGAREEVEAWLENMDADDDVQNIYVALA